MTQYQNQITPFHIAFPVRSLDETRKFYGQVLQCLEGRSTENWIDWDLYGHQISTHLNPDECNRSYEGSKVDGISVPCLHFGVILTWDKWEELKERIITQTIFPPIKFVVEPYIRFRGEKGEQATMFFLDPSGNALEFKSFKDMTQIFEPYAKAS